MNFSPLWGHEKCKFSKFRSLFPRNMNRRGKYLTNRQSESTFDLSS